jgi:hypothetical protein
MLQLASWQRCGAVATHVTGALRRSCNTRRSNAAATRVAVTLL